ncbi:MAG: electron transport complex subunit E [Tissierellia bacterium]|nr:electron transport complex subunit E [Tissierellia bacterium]
MNKKQIIKDGIIGNNPVLVQLVGLCSVLGVSTTVVNAVGMSLSVIFVLVLSNIVVSILRNFIPDKVRIPAYIVIIATFVTLVQMILQAYVPAIYDSLGLFIPLIVVNCIILARAESFASKNSLGLSLIDGFANGIGYSWVIIVLAFIRELFGSGAILGKNIIGDLPAIGMVAAAPGAFIILGIMYAVYNQIQMNREKGGQ